MFGLISQQSQLNLMSINDDALINGGGGNGGGGNFATVNTSANLPFDFDLSKINQAVSRGNTAADIRSAYEVFTTGYSSGRGYGYAQDIQRRFSPGLIQTYGASDIRTAAANYLDSAGLPRLASFISPTPTPVQNSDDVIGDFFGLPPPPNPVTSPVGNESTIDQKNPFEILADSFSKLFGNAVYNPPLQQQSYGYTPSELSTPLTQGGSSGIGLYVILAIVGIVGYFLYKRFAS